MAEVRIHAALDDRREQAVEMLKQQARQHCPDSSYDADIEYLEYAVIAFAEEWAALALHDAVEDRAQALAGEKIADANTGFNAAYGLQTQYRNERDRLRAALELIARDHCGVCPEFEVCDHRACRDSHAAYQIAREALDA